jgi:hypothetical protein
MAVAKIIAITERVSLEFRVEFFNALNHTEMYQMPDTDLNHTQTFGQMLYTVRTARRPTGGPIDFLIAARGIGPYCRFWG